MKKILKKDMLYLMKEKLKLLFEKGAFHIFIGNFIMKFIGLFGSIFIVRLLTKNEYGMLGYVENFYSYGYILAGLGLNMAALRYGIIIKEPEKKKGLYLWVIKMQLAIDICLASVIAIFSCLYPHPTLYAKAAHLLVILVIAIPFTDIANTNLSFERSQLANKRYMYLSITAALISIIMRVFGAAIQGITGTILFRVLAEILSCTLLLLIVYKKYFKGIQCEKIEKTQKKEILIFSVNNMLANGIWALFMLTDVFLIGRLLNNPDILADYKVAYVIPSNLAIITSAITVFVTPYFVSHEKDHAWVKNSYFKVLFGNVLLLGLLSAVLFIFAPYFINILYGKEYLNVVPVMRILLIAYLINSGIKTMTAGLLAAMGYAKENLCISIVAFFIQVIMATYVLPRFGIIGLAFNNVFVYLLMSVLSVMIFGKKFEIFKRTKNE